jgi:hypothetical protein
VLGSHEDGAPALGDGMRRSALDTVRRRQRPVQTESTTSRETSRPPGAHPSNTGGARRSAWKSVVPTSSSHDAQTTAKAVVASPPLIPRTRERLRRTTHLVALWCPPVRHGGPGSDACQSRVVAGVLLSFQDRRRERSCTGLRKYHDRRSESPPRRVCTERCREEHVLTARRADTFWLRLPDWILKSACVQGGDRQAACGGPPISEWWRRGR